MKVVVTQNQTIWDIATQYTGDSGNAIDLLLVNDKLNDELMVGETLIIPSELVSVRHVAFFEGRDLSVGTQSDVIQGYFILDYDNNILITSDDEYLEYN